jgi:hypothetical protein
MKKSVFGFLILLSCLVLGSTQVLAADHTVISEKPLYLADGDTGEWFSDFSGHSVISWKESTRYGFFNAQANIRPDLAYEFTLVSISSSTANSIEGLWDISRNGIPACIGCVGKAYGIDGPVGSYFKLYVGDSQCNQNQWLISGYITSRFDF